MSENEKISPFANALSHLQTHHSGPGRPSPLLCETIDGHKWLAEAFAIGDVELSGRLYAAARNVDQDFVAEVITAIKDPSLEEQHPQLLMFLSKCQELPDEAISVVMPFLGITNSAVKDGVDACMQRLGERAQTALMDVVYGGDSARAIAAMPHLEKLKEIADVADIFVELACHEDRPRAAVAMQTLQTLAIDEPGLVLAWLVGEGSFNQRCFCVLALPDTELPELVRKALEKIAGAPRENPDIATLATLANTKLESTSDGSTPNS